MPVRMAGGKEISWDFVIGQPHDALSGFPRAPRTCAAKASRSRFPLSQINFAWRCPRPKKAGASVPSRLRPRRHTSLLRRVP